jgi:hypothetical protein
MLPSVRKHRDAGQHRLHAETPPHPVRPEAMGHCLLVTARPAERPDREKGQQREPLHHRRPL